MEKRVKEFKSYLLLGLLVFLLIVFGLIYIFNNVRITGDVVTVTQIPPDIVKTNYTNEYYGYNNLWFYNSRGRIWTQSGCWYTLPGETQTRYNPNTCSINLTKSYAYFNGTVRYTHHIETVNTTSNWAWANNSWIWTFNEIWIQENQTGKWYLIPKSAWYYLEDNWRVQSNPGEGVHNDWWSAYTTLHEKPIRTYKGKTDIAVYDPNNGAWFIQKSSEGFKNFSFGWAQALPTSALSSQNIIADYDGDGKQDVALYFRNPTGNSTWYFQRSRDGFLSFDFGWANTYPSAGDFNGDGYDDIAVYCQSNCVIDDDGTWYYLLYDPMKKNFGKFFKIHFGFSQAYPYVGDFDGDGKDDIAAYWWNSQAGYYSWSISKNITGSPVFQVFNFNTAAADIPVPADYDGDGKTDLAIYNPVGYNESGTACGLWKINYSSSEIVRKYCFGWWNTVTNNTPVPGDYDDDGRTDMAVYQPLDPSGVGLYEWAIRYTNNGSVVTRKFGYGAAIPVPDNYDGDFCTTFPSNWGWNSELYRCVEGTITKKNCLFSPVADTVWNDLGLNGKFTQNLNTTLHYYEPTEFWAAYNETPGECNYKCRNSSFIWNPYSSSCDLKISQEFCEDYKTMTECNKDPLASTQDNYQKLLVGKRTVNKALNLLRGTTNKEYCDSSSQYLRLEEGYGSFVRGCECVWDTIGQNCSSKYTTVRYCYPLSDTCSESDRETGTVEEGTCEFSSPIIENFCNSTGRMKYTQQALWTGTEPAPEYCKANVRDLGCPVSTPLGFFNWINFTISIFVIFFIYAILLRRK
jgi:hypothetical protein